MMVFGVNKAFLFPSGSSNDKINGISHLFEHFMIKKIHAKFGFTTEDYFIIFTNNLSDFEMAESIKRMVFDNNELRKEKILLIKEIEKKKMIPGRFSLKIFGKNLNIQKALLEKNKRSKVFQY